jgi:hypothetical protein
MEKGARFWSSAKVERWKKRRERLICGRMNVGKSREKQRKILQRKKSWVKLIYDLILILI